MSDEEKTLKVVVIEDTSQWQELLQEDLDALGCVVIAVVEELQVVFDEIIPNLITLGVTHVIVDGNLTSGDFSDSDGKQIVQKIREKAPKVITIDFSSWQGLGAHKKLEKSTYSISKLKTVLEIE